MVEITKSPFHQVRLINNPIPLIMKPTATAMHILPAKFLVALSLKNQENAQEGTGQIIPSLNSNAPLLCPKNNR
jgi:hypothetical protein